MVFNLLGLDYEVRAMWKGAADVEEHTLRDDGKKLLRGYERETCDSCVPVFSDCVSPEIQIVDDKGIRNLEGGQSAREINGHDALQVTVTYGSLDREKPWCSQSHSLPLNSQRTFQSGLSM
jgi:hypothetical protein